MTITLTAPSVEKLIKYSLHEVEGKPEFRVARISDINRMSAHSKIREIMVPNSAMRVLQNNLREYLRALPVDYTYATAYLPGSQVRKNVLRHKSGRFFYLVDLASAFDLIQSDRLAELITELVYQMAEEAMEQVSLPYLRPIDPREDEKLLVEFLKKYCMKPSGVGLPQGGPASQDLFNIYMSSIVDPLFHTFCRKRGITYSRYGDDLTFSSRRSFNKRTRQEVRGILIENGLKISHHKCHVVDLAKVGGQSVLINGIRLTYGGKMFSPKSFILESKSLLQAAIKSQREGLEVKAISMAGLVLHIAQGREPTSDEKVVRRLLSAVKDNVRNRRSD